ncbi:MAG TPA: peptidylprolyl isomerase [Candidatus Nanoarchaeia archaeon]|nr:peptidylprolyl isomerase [Candidatus Nanoarchaeia archaeon]
MINKKDFIELEYTGKIKGTDEVFDTTSEKVAKDSGIYSKGAQFKPVTIIVGEGQLVKGLDNDIIGKEPNKEYDLDLKPEDAYGSKNAKYIQLISTAKFLKQQIQPMPGLQVNIDGRVGTIKTVSGGRTLVDFNHPLAGKELSYMYKIIKVITDEKEKIASVLKANLDIDSTVTLEGKKAKIIIKEELPEEIKAELEKKIKEIIPMDSIAIEKEENLNNSTPKKEIGG